MTIKDNIKELSQTLKSGLETEGTEIKEKDPGSLYKENIPEGLDEKIIKKVSDYNTDFIAASDLAVSELGLEMMKDDSSIERVTSTISMLSDKVSFAMDRKKTYPNHLGDGKEVVKYGVVNVNYSVKGGKNAGQLKKVRAEINELAEKLLS